MAERETTKTASPKGLSKSAEIKSYLVRKKITKNNLSGYKK